MKIGSIASTERFQRQIMTYMQLVICLLLTKMNQSLAEFWDIWRRNLPLKVRKVDCALEYTRQKPNRCLVYRNTFDPLCIDYISRSLVIVTIPYRQHWKHNCYPSLSSLQDNILRQYCGLLCDAQSCPTCARLTRMNE